MKKYRSLRARAFGRFSRNCGILSAQLSIIMIYPYLLYADATGIDCLLSVFFNVYLLATVAVLAVQALVLIHRLRYGLNLSQSYWILHSYRKFTAVVSGLFFAMLSFDCVLCDTFRLMGLFVCVFFFIASAQARAFSWLNITSIDESYRAYRAFVKKHFGVEKSTTACIDCDLDLKHALRWNMFFIAYCIFGVIMIFICILWAGFCIKFNLVIVKLPFYYSNWNFALLAWPAVLVHFLSVCFIELFQEERALSQLSCVFGGIYLIVIHIVHLRAYTVFFKTSLVALSYIAPPLNIPTAAILVTVSCIIAVLAIIAKLEDVYRHENF